MSQPAVGEKPYPGLRPFAPDQAHLFFGREEPASELVRRLGLHRFLAVIGVSGSGKSSLVHCGVLPTLQGGFLRPAGASWRIAEFRPGDAPIRNLAKALVGAGVIGPSAHELDAELQGRIVETVLRGNSRGLIEAAGNAGLAEGENLLVVVDQFEEMFRYRDASSAGARDEGAAFVRLLLQASRPPRKEDHDDLRIYVMITMRSDFLGDCAQFRDLPEAINKGLFLIPRMTRAQQREAIEGPARVGARPPGGGERIRAGVDPSLLQRFLNDVGERPERLPILQHALMQTWKVWERRRADTEPIGLEHYLDDEVGGMEEALDNHAEEAYAELTEEGRRIAKRLFQALTERDEDERMVRRPTTVGEVTEMVGLPRNDVEEVIEVFARPGRTFLWRYGDDGVDISHESLIAGWRRLGRWVAEEAEWAKIYRRLAERAQEKETIGASLYRGPELVRALDWLAKAEPSEIWARRYKGDFALAKRFLEDSESARSAREEAARRAERAKQRRRIYAVAAAGLALTAAGVATSLIRASAERAELLERQQQLDDAEAALEAGDPLLGALLFAEELRGGREPVRGAPVARRIASVPLPVAIIGGSADTVLSAKPSPDGTRVVTSSNDPHVRVWPADGRGDPAVLVHALRPRRVGVANAGLVVTFGRDDTLRIWSVEELGTTYENPRRVLSAGTPGDRATEVIFAPSGGGAFVITGGGAGRLLAPGGEEIVDLSIPSRLRPQFADGRGGTVTWSHDGSTVAAVGEDGTLYVWRSGDRSGAPTAVIPQPVELERLVASGDGFLIATVSGTQLYVWRPGSADTARTYSMESSISAVALDRGGTLVAAADEAGRLRAWNLEQNRLRDEWDAAGPVSYLEFLPSVGLGGEPGRRLLAVVGANGFCPGAVQVWKFDDPFPVDGALELTWPRSPLCTATASEDGARIVTTTEGASAIVWRGDGVADPIVLPGDGSATDATTAALVSLATAALADSSQLLPEQPPVLADATYVIREGAVHGDLLATISDEPADFTPRLWKRDEPGGPFREVRRLEGASTRITGLRFDATGGRVVIASGDGIARVWTTDRASRPVELRHPRPLRDAAFIEDGRVVTLDQDRLRRAWSVSWTHLTDVLRGSTSACLSRRERELLGQEPATARARYRACETGQGRTTNEGTEP